MNEMAQMFKAVVNKEIYSAIGRMRWNWIMSQTSEMVYLVRHSL